MNDHQRQIDNLIVGGNKDWSKFLEKAGWDIIRIQ